MEALLAPPKVTSAMSVMMVGCQGQTEALLVLSRVIDTDFETGCRSQRKCLSRSPRGVVIVS